jgi:hypothetical protein
MLAAPSRLISLLETMFHRIPIAVLVLSLALAHASPVSAQTYATRKARRQFITISYDWLNTQPLHFAEHPLSDLVGREVVPAQFETSNYRTRDGGVLIDVLEFSRRSRGAGVTLYPFGANVGAALGIRGSYEDLPAIRIAFSGEGAPPDYELTGARAYDVSAGLYMMDHATGWGLGGHAFISGGVGRIKAATRDGNRYFAEGGGGINSGPIGVELSVKFAVNHFADPVDHRFITIPVTLRATVSF